MNYYCFPIDIECSCVRQYIVYFSILRDPYFLTEPIIYCIVPGLRSSISLVNDWSVVNRGIGKQKIQVIIYFLERIILSCCQSVRYVSDAGLFLVTPVAKLSCVRAFSVSPFASVQKRNLESN